MATDLTQTISDNASGPKRAQGDSGSVEQHGLQDQIAADRHVGSKDASKSANRGIRMNRMSPPGAGEMG